MYQRLIKILFVITLLNLLLFSSYLQAETGPIDKVDPKTRCSVCGMFVAKYDVWITQLRLNGGTLNSFDGVKDMMAYYFSPRQYGAKEDVKISELWVKDYYSLKWLDAREAFYVQGSDVYGPMGHEFIPFSSKAAAETFMKDHHGKKLLTFDEITAETVEAMRSGMKMKH